jgi:ABC-2 type transport system ATP-binding protein
VYPRSKSASSDLANAVAETVGKEGWRFDELHTEDGKLDEVFRAITSPDTAAVKA